MKTIREYEFDSVVGAVTFTKPFDVERIALITNVTAGVIIYQFNNPNKGGTKIGNVLNLEYDTSSMNNSDDLRIDYEDESPLTPAGAMRIGNSREKFYEPFSDYPLETFDETKHPSDVVAVLGNGYGASWLNISKSTKDLGTTTQYLSRESFTLPNELQIGISKSQEILGQYAVIDFVEVDPSTGEIVTEDNVDVEQAIQTSTISVSTNFAEISVNNNHIVAGDFVEVYGCVDNRLNVGPIRVVYVTRDGKIGVPIGLANGSYASTGGFVRRINIHQNARNSFGIVLMGQNDDNIYTYSKVSGATAFVSNDTGVSTDWRLATSSSPAFGSLSLQPRGHIAIRTRAEDIQVIYRPANSSVGNTAVAPITTAIVPSDLNYKLRISFTNLRNLARPVAEISSISKSGSTVATIVTPEPHGLAAGSVVAVTGVRDQTAFANTNLISVTSVTNPTTFVASFGSSTTATNTLGGAIFLNNAFQPAPVLPQAVQSISVSSSGSYKGLLNVTLSAAAAGVLRGDVYELYGVVPDLAVYKGIPLVVYEITGSQIVLGMLDGTDLSAITTTNSGGVLIKRSDLRIHTLTIRSHDHTKVEIGGTSFANTDKDQIRVNGNVGASQGGGSATNMWLTSGYSGVPVTDVASAAITSNNTSSVISPGTSANIGTLAHQYSVSVTAVSGTNPTMDVIVQESPDSGTTWFDIYHFPRITSTGVYVSPVIQVTLGSRVRYVRNIGGTSPSFTNSIIRSMYSRNAPVIRQFYDRSISLTTNSSTSPAFHIDSPDATVVFGVKIGAATTPPVIKLQGNYDGTSTGWHDLTDISGSPITLTAVANSYVSKQAFNVNVAQVRLIVSTAGATVTGDYVHIKTISS